MFDQSQPEPASRRPYHAAHTRRRGTRSLAIVLGLALVAASCGDDDDAETADTATSAANSTLGSAVDTSAEAPTDATGGTASDTTDAEPADTTAPAPAGPADESLEPFKLGFVNQEAGSTGTYLETSAAVEAAVEYLNTETGGLDGHPIEIVKCATDGTVASTQKCAEEMVNGDVVYVTTGVDNNLQALYPTLEGAGIPLIGGLPIAGADFSAENAYFFIAGGAAAYPGMAHYVLNFMPDVTEVGVVINDTPGAAAALPLVANPLQAAGIEVTDVKVPSTQSDWLAPFASVRDFDAIAVAVSPANCVSLAKARDGQGSDVPMVSVSSCYSQTVVEGAGETGLNGWVVNQYFDDPQGESPEAVQYREIMGQYAGADANLSGFSPVAFTNIMTAYNNVLQPLGFEGATAEAIVEKVTDPAGGKVFMGPEYQCRQPDAPFPAICNYNLQWFDIENGKLTNPTGFEDITATIVAGIS